MRKQKPTTPTTAAPVDSYKHKDTRKRIPTQEQSEKLSLKDKRPTKKKYDYDPSLDPQLVWSGKAEAGTDFGVATVPIYVQEKIASEGIIARLKLGVKESSQTMLFGETAEQQADKAVSFYEHEDNWQNRMILGDSLLVMNSLLEKEKMRGKVQCIYIDPPYGIKFGSNWQASTKKRDVKDNKLEDMIRQPEQIKAFRDTWELGVHTYLTYLRDRLITARELLTESGSCFVQISDENVHLIRNVMDEVFGSENFVTEIVFAKTAGLGGKLMDTTNDYIVWYGRDKSQVKYHQLYRDKKAEGAYGWLELSDGTRRKMSESESTDPSTIPKGSRIFRLDNLTSQTPSETTTFSFSLDGRRFSPKKGGWKTNEKGMERLIAQKRIMLAGDTPSYVRYLDDFPAIAHSNLWTDTGVAGYGDPKIYVVQTITKVIQRCILMVTDPGDIVLDPTCGSGTTAVVSEQWGRRWITIDTSRVALALARTRLMTAKYSWYKLKERNNVRGGFEYKTIPHVTLKSLASNEPADKETLYDQPVEEKEMVRVSGPFTVESLAPHRVSDAQEMLSSENFVEVVIANLQKAGVQTGDRGARLEFANLDILPGGPEVQASGEYMTKDGLKKVAVAIGPEFGSVDDDFIRAAARVAGRFADLLVVSATSFEASAFTEASDIGKLRVMKVKINPDLSMGDLLKKTGSGNLFLAFGEPEIQVKETKDGVTVEILGVDVYDPVKSEIRSSGSGDVEHEIAAWFIDTNYSGDAFFVTHAYFLSAENPYEKLKKALKADINPDVFDSLVSTVSRPFAKPVTGKIAVKVINHYGDEVMKIIEVK